MLGLAYLPHIFWPFSIFAPCTRCFTWRCAQIARSLSFCAAHTSEMRQPERKTKQTKNDRHIICICAKCCAPRTGRNVARSNECQTILFRRFIFAPLKKTRRSIPMFCLCGGVGRRIENKVVNVSDPTPVNHCVNPHIVLF